MKRILYLILAVVSVMVSCDDSTDTLGYQMMPVNDMTQTFDTTFFATSQTVEAGNVLARTSLSYFGQFTDPESYTSIKSDFLSQFHCNEGFAFPDSVVNNKISSTYLYLYISDYVGDSLQSLKMSVYPLDSIIDPDKDYYTDIDPTQYYDANSKPIAEKWLTYSDRTMTDSARYANEGLECIKIPLPNEVGQAIYDDYRAHPEHFANTDAFINSGLPCSKGFYFKLEAGDGLLVTIDISQFTLSYDMYDESSKVTSTVSSIFAATEEVVQATRFSNLNLESLIDDKDATYIKSPAGLFTELTVPVEDFVKSPYQKDSTSINCVNLVFTRYNDLVSSGFKLNIPNKVLLVRADEYYNNFFERYKLPDNETSFITSFSKTSNTIAFNNITPLIRKMIKERNSGSYSKDYNKVLLIPVEATYDSNNSGIVKLCHDFSLTSAKLVGGRNDRVKLEVVYSSYR